MKSNLLAAIVLIALGCAAVTSHAFIDDATHHNTISGDDEGKIIALYGRALDFSQDLSSVMLGLIRPDSDIEAYRTLFCVQRIDANAMLMVHDLYGATVASQMSTTLQYRLDERITIGTVKNALEQAARSVKFSRGELNQILGGCARQRRLAYDKATGLLILVEDVGKLVAPMLQQIEISVLQPN
jgi:hypothetical protein